MGYGRTGRNKSQDTYMGFLLNNQTFDKLKLVALLDSNSMSGILKEQLYKYLDTKGEIHEMIKELGKMGYDEWNKAVIKNNNKKGWKTPKQITKKFEIFLKQKRRELKKAYMTEKLTDKIIQAIEETEIEEHSI